MAEWPTRTGTRTQVMLTARSGRPRIFRVSWSELHLFRRVAVVAERLAERQHVVRDRRRDRSTSSAASPSAVSPSWRSSSSTPGLPVPRHRLERRHHDERSPAARRIGSSAITKPIVVQFGHATMPRCFSSASGIDLGHDERDVRRPCATCSTCRSRRRRASRPRAQAPSRACPSPRRTRSRRRRTPRACASRTSTSRPCEAHLRAGRAPARERAELAHREARSASTWSSTSPTAPGRPDDRNGASALLVVSAMGFSPGFKGLGEPRIGRLPFSVKLVPRGRLRRPPAPLPSDRHRASSARGRARAQPAPRPPRPSRS